MSRQTFPTFFDQPGCLMHNFAIDGTSIGGTPGSTGLDGRGKFLCNISRVSNQYTIDWLVAFGDIPYVFFQTAAGQTDTYIDIVTSTPQQLVFNSLKISDGSAQDIAKLSVHVDGYDTTSYVS